RKRESTKAAWAPAFAEVTKEGAGATVRARGEGERARGDREGREAALPAHSCRDPSPVIPAKAGIHKGRMGPRFRGGDEGGCGGVERTMRRRRGRGVAARGRWRRGPRERRGRGARGNWQFRGFW